MFPFTVRFSRTLKISLNPDQINKLLSFSREILLAKDVNYLSINTNPLKFTNRVLQLGPNWTLMAMVDSGFLEINETKNNYLKITYGINMITVWIISTIGAIFMFFASHFEVIFALIAFGGLGFINFLIAVLRHLDFFYTMTNKMEQKLLEEKK